MVDEPRIVEIDMPDLVIFIPKTPVLDFILFFFVQTLIFTVRNVDVQLGTTSCPFSRSSLAKKPIP